MLGDNGGDQTILLLIRKALPTLAAQPLEGAIAHLILHARRTIHPIAEINVGQAFALGAANVIENNVIAKPAARLMFRVVEGVDHRQPVALPIGEAGANQTAGHTIA